MEGRERRKEGVLEMTKRDVSERENEKQEEKCEKRKVKRSEEKETNKN